MTEEMHQGVALLVEVGDEAPFLEVEEVRGLVAEGKERGFLTFEEITAPLRDFPNVTLVGVISAGDASQIGSSGGSGRPPGPPRAVMS